MKLFRAVDRNKIIFDFCVFSDKKSFYDDEIIQEENLCVPHADMHNRLFVLEPLKEIAPYKRHPVYGKTIAEMVVDLEK